MKHLTTIFKKDDSGVITKEVKAYAIFISVTLNDAQRVSDALVVELGEERGKEKSAFICNCIVNGALEPVAQRCNTHALKILNAPHSLPYVLNDLADRLADIKKALLDWPTINEVKFVNKDSAEYKAWAREQDNEPS